MSERCEDSVSNRSLLSKANVDEIKVDAVREALAEYQKICDQIQVEEEQLSAFNQLLRSLSKAESADKEKIAQHKADAEKCVRRISTYDKQLLKLETSDALQSLLKTLKAKAFEEAEERGREALQEYYRQAEKEQERIVEEWREKRQVAEKKARQKQIGAIEAEIAQVKKDAQKINEAISMLGRCWFGKKKREKERLEAELAAAQNKLMSLHNKRQQLKNAGNVKPQAEQPKASSNIEILGEMVANFIGEHSKRFACEYLCHSALTKADATIFACFLIRAMCIGNAPSQMAAQDFSDRFVRTVKEKACSLYFPNNTAQFNRMFSNRTSYYDRVFMSKQGIENKIAAIVEVFEFIIKSDFVNGEYEDLSETSPLPILPNGIFGDLNCRAEVITFYQQLPEKLASQIQKI